MSALTAAPFLVWLGGALAGTAFGATRMTQQQNDPYSAQFPNAPPQGPGPWPGNHSQFPPVGIDKRQVQRAMLLQNEKNIRKDVARLYDLAGKLRKEVSNTDSSEVLSVKMIQTTEQIEKLARHIRKLASG